MATPENVKATAAIGALNGTNAFIAVSTPVSVWGWSVHNATGSNQTGGVGSATNAVLTLSYASGTTAVPAYGYEVDQLALQVTHTNMTLLVFYTPYQQ